MIELEYSKRKKNLKKLLYISGKKKKSIVGLPPTQRVWKGELREIADWKWLKIWGAIQLTFFSIQYQAQNLAQVIFGVLRHV